ncbi:MAG: hypothetical protein LBL83_10625 [Clostridiales bacterium]|nr:hypothetical protein [Clostridiales bacterium]
MSFVNSNWYIAMTFCFVFFVAGRQLGEVPGSTRRTRRLTRLLLLAFALPSLLFPVAAAFDFFRLAPWYNTFRAVNRIELLSAVVAPFAGYATYMGGVGRAGQRGGGRGAPRRQGATLKSVMKPLAFPLSLLIVSASFAKPLIRPMGKDTAFGDRWVGGILMQSALSDSGPASLATVMNTVNGYEGSEYDICRRTYTDGAGTEFWHLARYAAEKGYRCEFLLAREGEDIPTPSVAYISPGAASGGDGGRGVGVGSGGNAGGNVGLGAGAGAAAVAGAVAGNSYVALLENSGGKLTVGDPQRGMAELTYGEFMERYPYSGLVLAVSSRTPE